MSEQASPTEVWKAIPGYEGFYSVSDLGRVRRDKSGQGTRTRILTPWTDSKGYKRVQLNKNGFRHIKQVHRLVLIAFVGLNPDKPQANHKQGIKSDNRLSQLEWMNNRENQIHSIRVLGRKWANGERVATAKLSEADAVKIKILRIGGLERSEISERLNLPLTIIDEIIYGRSWKHVQILRCNLDHPEIAPVVLS